MGVNRQSFSLFLMGLLFFALTSVVYAGAKDYSVAFIDLSEAPYQDGVKRVMELQYVAKSELKVEDCFACADIDVIGSLASILPAPAEITHELLLRAIQGEVEAKKRMQKILEETHRSLDGLIVYQHTQEKVVLYGFGADIGSPMIQVEKKVKNYLAPVSFDQMLEQIVVQFPMRNP